jgi:hypothetical protein
MPARQAPLSLVSCLTALALVAGCSGGQPTSAPAPAVSAQPANVPGVIAPGGSNVISPGRVLAGQATFERPVDGDFTVEAFLLGKPQQVVAAGSANVIAPGGGNVIAPGGGNVIAPGGGNLIGPAGGNFRALAAPASTRASFSLTLPAAVPAGSFVKLVIRNGDQTLVSVLPTPAGPAASPAVTPAVTPASTLAYVLLSPRLEGAGQALFTPGGQAVPSLAQAVVSAYQALTDEAAPAFAEGADPTRRNALGLALGQALRQLLPSLAPAAVDDLLVLAPGVRPAIVLAVDGLNAGISEALAQGAPVPDGAYTGSFSLGNAVSLNAVPRRSGNRPPPKGDADTTVEVQPGEVRQPTSGPVIAPTP